MLLKELKLKRFRGIEEVAILFDRSTILVGENNTGKTTILEAVYCCLSRVLSRKTFPFDEYDFYLDAKNDDPTKASPIEIELRFEEEREDEWPDSVHQALDKAVQVRADDKHEVRFKVTAAYEIATKQFGVEWAFLDLNGNQLPGAKNPRLVQELQQLNPAFFLTAVRDATQHFQSRSTFWSPFTKNPQMDDAARVALEEQIGAINKSVLDAHAPFSEIKAQVAKTGKLVPLASTDLVSLEAFPPRIFEILNKTQVKLTSKTGAKLPIDQHGAGTQSLSVLFLFEAFLNARLSEAFDKDSEPLLALEEPEAHLHPSAIRSLWSVLNALKGQKIVATHSGELLASVPFKIIRRLARKDGKVQSFQLGASTLNSEEERKLIYHVRAKRGQLFFAKSWLLVEGESEFWFLPEAARILGLDLELEGVCCVEFAQCGLAPLIKTAIDFGIEWHVLVDGDQAGLNHAKTARNYLGSTLESQRLTVLSNNCLEHCLWHHGYQAVYEAAVGKPQRQHITAASGTPDYVDQTIRMAISSTSKPHLALAVIEAIAKSGSPGLPAAIGSALKTAVANAQV